MSKPTDNPRKALGKGLSALLPPRPRAVPQPETTTQQSVSTNDLTPLDPRTLPIGSIQPNPEQPREDFDHVKLEELAQSIRANGIIQPITVTHSKQGTYIIIAGERRWRAAQLAGLVNIPVYVRETEPERVLELALIENIQRADLNAVETAHAFRQLTERYGLSHDQVAERTGKDRSTVTNFIRLLKLTAPVLETLATGKISVGHARTLLNVTDPDTQWAACQRIVQQRPVGPRDGSLHQETDRTPEAARRAYGRSATGSQHPRSPGRYGHGVRYQGQAHLALGILRPAGDRVLLPGRSGPDLCGDHGEQTLTLWNWAVRPETWVTERTGDMGYTFPLDRGRCDAMDVRLDT